MGLRLPNLADPCERGREPVRVLVPHHDHPLPVCWHAACQAASLHQLQVGPLPSCLYIAMCVKMYSTTEYVTQTIVAPAPAPGKVHAWALHSRPLCDCVVLNCDVFAHRGSLCPRRCTHQSGPATLVPCLRHCCKGMAGFHVTGLRPAIHGLGLVSLRQQLLSRHPVHGTALSRTSAAVSMRESGSAGASSCRASD